MTKSRQGGEPLPARFYLRDTVTVARDLLGARLVRTFPDGSTTALVIVETEAYLGVGDRAAHTFGGRRTARVLPMWGPGGHAYVYSVYGMHHCLNVVTREEGAPEAVLVRAAVPEAWWGGAGVSTKEILASSGPGRLCRILALTRADSGASLAGPGLTLTAGPPRVFEVLVGPRVGVDYAGEAALWPLRFAVADCPAVTVRKTLAPLSPREGRRGTPPSRRSSSRSASPGREPGRRAR